MKVCVCVQDFKLWWCQCVCVGQSVCVTALRVCVLRGWRGNNILCVTESSNIHTEYTHTELHTNTEEHAHTELHTDYTQSITHPDSPQLINCEEAEPEEDPGQSAVRTKHSRVISYQVGGL